VNIGGQNLKIWKDILIADPVNAQFSGDLVYAGKTEPADLKKILI